MILMEVEIQTNLSQKSQKRVGHKLFSKTVPKNLLKPIIARK
jgi:hypothetical protein